MHCVSYVTISLIGFHFGQVLLRRRFVDGFFIWMYLFTVRCTFRMSTRRLYVILFVFSFRVTVISYFCCVVSYGGRRVFVSFRLTA